MKLDRLGQARARVHVLGEDVAVRREEQDVVERQGTTKLVLEHLRLLRRMAASLASPRRFVEGGIACHAFAVNSVVTARTGATPAGGGRARRALHGSDPGRR